MDSTPSGSAALDAHEDDVMSRIASAEKMGDIAESYGVSRVTLFRWLKKGGPAREAAHAAAKEAAGSAYAERAIEILNEGMEPTSAAQAQIIKARADWSMRLAGFMNREFSDRQDMNVGVVLDFGQLHLDALRAKGNMALYPRDKPLLLEGEVVGDAEGGAD